MTLERLLSGFTIASTCVAFQATLHAQCDFTGVVDLGCEDPTIQGCDLVIDGGFVTLDCAHDLNSLTIINSGVLKLPDDAEGLILNIAGDLVVDPTSEIRADKSGFDSQQGPGAGFSGLGVNAGGAGFGGAGGDSNDGILGGRTYGSVLQPFENGSGGGRNFDSNAFGGSGGGRLLLNVGGVARIDGVVSADGGNGGTNAGGGSGGSIRISCARFEGFGFVVANGGAGYNSHGWRGGGGGGGRVAIEYTDYAFSVPERNAVDVHFQANGGGGAERGGAGTIHLHDLDQPRGTVYVANDGSFGANTEFADETTIDADLVIAPGGTVGPRVGETGFELRVTGDATVELGGRFSATGKGFGQAEGPGAGTNGSSADAGGAGHAGAGGDSNDGVPGGGTYGSIRTPVTLGSGGGRNVNSGSSTGGRGGGAMRVTVGGVLTIDGEFNADGKNAGANGGGGAGGSIWIEAQRIEGSTGSISANGGAGYNSHGWRGGGGGGGRVAIYADDDAFTGRVSAHGGGGEPYGGAGTIYRKVANQPLGTILVENNGNLAEATELSSDAVLNGHLVVGPGGRVGPPHGEDGLHVYVAGDARIELGGEITARARGYTDEVGSPGRGDDGAGQSAGGGGYGGTGGMSNNGVAGGAAYGLPETPVSLGSAGGRDVLNPNSRGGVGGGALRLTASGVIDLAGGGVITADGEDNSGSRSGGGSGGSLWLEAERIAGFGSISANGGAGYYSHGWYGGGGGGGRVAIYTPQLDVDPNSITVDGGPGWQNGEDGTIFVADRPRTAITVTSTPDSHALPITGSLSDQIAELNAGPPAFDAGVWTVPLAKLDDHRPSAFRCSCPSDEPPPVGCGGTVVHGCEGFLADPLAEPYVSAFDFLTGAHEVTLDNCGSAWYRFTFQMPVGFEDPTLLMRVNADDVGIAYLNGIRISGRLTEPGCDPDPCEGAADPCYDMTDVGKDRFDQDGRPVLSWPTPDLVGVDDQAAFLAGTNELVIGVCGDAGYYDPTGVEFDATITFTPPECLADLVEPFGLLDLADITTFVDAFTSGDPSVDFDGNGLYDLDDIQAFVDSFIAGCGNP